LTHWHILTPEAVASELQSDLTHGLTAAEAQRRLQASGPNVLPEAARPSALALFDAEPLTFHQWGLALGLGTLPFLILEGGKQVWGTSRASPGPVRDLFETCPGLA
jgi:hypothetical protein